MNNLHGYLVVLVIPKYHETLSHSMSELYLKQRNQGKIQGIFVYILLYNDQLMD